MISASPTMLRAAIAADGRVLPGMLELPARPLGVVLFAHAGGVGRLNPQNTYLGGTLRQAGIGTLLFDLLTEDEAENRDNMFDLRLLALRMLHATEWVVAQPETHDLPLGYLGADTGAAAAVVAASQAGHVLRAVVARGGRPDLADDFLPGVAAPTLFIVGGNDAAVLKFNQAAMARLSGIKELAVVPGASHGFSEPGALAEVAHLATHWFRRHLSC